MRHSLLTRSAAIETQHKVLLVDDDAVSLELMSLLLAHEGHQVLRANDAGAALELLTADQAARPDVLLVDLQMPGVSGGQLAQRIRDMEGPGPLLLAMSATEAQRQQLMAFDGFLLKPLAPGDLRRALKPRRRERRAAIRAAHTNSHSKRAAAESREPLDMAVTGKLLTMMPVQALKELIAASIADTRVCVATLRTQLENPAVVSQTAHRIKGAALMVGASRIAGIAAGLEAGGDKAAATPSVLDDLLSACSELEGMLGAAKLQNTRAPHHESTDRDNAGNT
jgi:CheY-like chemotaxis protein/HPt (histidine-containing phosphotransfer) domain-containing protein